MWVGSRHHTFLRVAGFHILFIWTTSLLLNRTAGAGEPASKRWRWLRVGINYVNKNFYQQILFFILPIYYASATSWSKNMLFVALVAASAVLSTLDVVYDRHLSRRRLLAGGFFAFNLFACVNVALPILWSISNTASIRMAALSALAGFVTIARRPSALSRGATWGPIAAGAVALVAAVDFARPWIPPAPLRLVNTSFGLALDRQALRIGDPVGQLPANWSGRVYAVTGLVAPLGLRDSVALLWYRDGRLISSSVTHNIVGGRQEGFLLWSSAQVAPTREDTALRLEVTTDGGQLIGRSSLTAGRPAPPRN